MLDLTADNEVDENHSMLDKNNKKILRQLGIRFAGCTNEDTDHRLLAQDCLYHDCNDYCLGRGKTSGQIGYETCRTYRFGFGMEETTGERNQSTL